MPGIERIQEHQEEQRAASTFSNNTELILNADGDQALIAVVSSGKDDTDGRIDEYFRHSYQQTGDDGSERWVFSFCKRSVEQQCELCDNDVGAQRRFGFWAYVYSMFRKAPGTSDGWKEITHAGEKLYQREINDFRIVSLPFGRNNMYWNQFCGIFYENGAMNQSILRIKRVGSKRDTTWSVQVTAKVVDWKTIGNGGDNLSSVKEYFIDTEKKREQKNESVALSSAIEMASSNADMAFSDSDEPDITDLF